MIISQGIRYYITPRQIKEMTWKKN